ncbi:MAG: PQQ-binding-like beta-propeller repeat protein [Bacillota bacterium]
MGALYNCRKKPGGTLPADGGQRFLKRCLIFTLLFLFSLESSCSLLLRPAGATVSATAAKSLQTSAPWPMRGHDLRHTGRSPYLGSQHGDLLWVYETDGPIYSSCAIGADGAIYFGSDDGYVYALDAGGTPQWRFKTEGPVRSTPALAADGTIYVGSADNHLYALRPDGTRLRRYYASNAVDSSPAIWRDGTIYAGLYVYPFRYLYALKPAGGTAWSYRTGDIVDGSLADLAAGRELRKEPVYSSPAVGGDGTVYIGSYDGYLYAITPQVLHGSGTLRWRFATTGKIRSSPAIAPDGTVYIGSDDKYLYAVGSDGLRQWRYETGGAIHSSPALGIDGSIYFGSEDGYIYALSAKGTLQWRYKTGDKVMSSPALGRDGTIYIGSDDGFLYALAPAGNLKWRYDCRDKVQASPAITAEGSVVVGSLDGRLYAFTDRYGQAEMEKITVVPQELRLDPGASVIVAVQALFKDGSTASLSRSNVNWESGNHHIATVSFGQVWGVGGGETTITATHQGLQARLKVIVSGPPAYRPPETAAEKLELARVRLSWQEVRRADGYFIFRSRDANSYDENFPLNDFPIKGTTFTDLGLDLVPGETYYYWIFPIIGETLGRTAQRFTKVAAKRPAITLQLDNPVANLDGDTVRLETPPTLYKWRTFVPLRFVAEHLDAGVTWDAKEQKITVNRAQKTIELWVNSPRVLVNGSPEIIDIPPVVMENRTMVPLRFLAAHMDVSTEWFPETREIILTPQ